MALSARQITLPANTPTNLFVLGNGTGFTFKVTRGTVSDPMPVTVKNEDPSLILWIGGPDVSPTNGQSLAPGQTFTVNMYGGDMPWGFSTGSPIVSVLAGRQ
jgi:hypothetical protein